MKWMKTGLGLLIIAAGLMLSSQPAQAQDCVVQLGFKTLRDLIPHIVGECLANEQHDPHTGSARQQTTNGFLFWRKADNWTGFSDGQNTWINGPQGLQWRSTTKRFPWETATSAGAEAHRLTLEQLRNGEYRLPLLGDEETAIRFEDGQGSIRFGEGATEQVRAGLIDDIAAFGDLDSDGLADAAVLVFVDPGGSGTFVNLIAMVDRGGAPVQVAREFLGDRVRAQSLTISGGEIVVTMLTHGPDDRLCCPSLTVSRKFRLADGGLGLVPTQTVVVEASPDDQQPRLTLEQLRNGEYRLPLLGDEETPIRFDDGQGSIRFGEGATEQVHAGLDDDIVAFGDLDDDGIADAVVVVYINYGGTGTFIRLVAVLDRDGAPVQAGRVLLGDRVSVESMTISSGEISVNMFTHGPGDGLCCPSLNVTRKFRLQAGRIASSQFLVLEAPLPGQTVASGVEVRGRTSTLPASGGLTYLVYDARGGVIGMGRIPVTAELDQSGAFAEPIEFNSGAGGPGRIEVIDEHWTESSALARTAVQVILEAAPLTYGRTSREPIPELVLEAPASGATVGATVELRGRISIMPFEKNLTYRIYDQAGTMVGESYITVEGDYDGPGTFAKSIPLTGVYANGPVRIEVRGESVIDGALIVSTSVTVLFADGG